MSVNSPENLYCQSRRRKGRLRWEGSAEKEGVNVTALKELKHYGRPTCSKQSRPVGRRRYGQQARPLTSFVDNTIDVPWRNFPSSEFGTKFQRQVPLFLGTRISL